MALYVDSSALLKRSVEGAHSARAEEALSADPDLVAGRHTIVEVRRNLARLLDGRSLAEARAALTTDLDAFAIVELGAATCELAATVAEQTSLRTLDALDLGATRRVGDRAITVLTFDLRQVQAACSLGFAVIGA